MISFNGRFVTPGKIVCVGRNYVDHIEELGNEIPTDMVIFMKPSSVIKDELNSLHAKDEIHYEGELSFVIENKKIAGVGFGLDLTKRELQSKLKEKQLPWERAKCFDGSALFSCFTKIEESDIDELSLRLFINDRLVQDGKVEQMMYKPKDMNSEINTFCELKDWDIIMSGTPRGVGTVKKEDKFLGQVYLKNKLLIEKEWVAK